MSFKVTIPQNVLDAAVIVHAKHENNAGLTSYEKAAYILCGFVLDEVGRQVATALRQVHTGAETPK